MNSRERSKGREGTEDSVPRLSKYEQKRKRLDDRSRCQYRAACKNRPAKDRRSCASCLSEHRGEVTDKRRAEKPLLRPNHCSACGAPGHRKGSSACPKTGAL